MILFLVSVIFAASAAGEYREPSKGTHAFVVSCKSDAELSLVRRFEQDRDFDFLHLTPHFEDTVDVLVAARQAERFEMYLKRHGIAAKVVSRNLELAIEREAGEHGIVRRSVADEPYNFTHFPTYDEINKYLFHLSKEHGSLVRVLNMGMSYEGRNMYLAKISSGDRKKPAMFIEAGIHAREWIAPTTALYAIAQLVKPKNRHVLEHVDFYVLPSLNPDGYQYSHSKILEHRLWRKSRAIFNDSNCTGVDLNRNFATAWQMDPMNDTCSNIYPGTGPFSEPESRNLRDFVMARKDDIKVYISLHSAAQAFLYPWAYTSKPTNHVDRLRRIGERAIDAVSSVRGTPFRLGSAIDTMSSPIFGTSLDWAYGGAGVELSYVIELPQNLSWSLGYLRFLIGRDQIVPVGREIFEAVKVFAECATTGCGRISNSPVVSEPNLSPNFHRNYLAYAIVTATLNLILFQ